MQATARRLSVVSATSYARRRLIRDVRPTNGVCRQPTPIHSRYELALPIFDNVDAAAV